MSVTKLPQGIGKVRTQDNNLTNKTIIGGNLNGKKKIL